MLAHMDLGIVIEYDIDGNQLWSMDTPKIWSAEPLENGNILLCGNDRRVREVNKQGDVVWDFKLDNYPQYNMTKPQIATRLENGNTIINGYSQGSRVPAEFNITPYLINGENKLAVEVYKYCDGSYLEDMDFWRLSGIFRDVLFVLCQILPFGMCTRNQMLIQPINRLRLFSIIRLPIFQKKRRKIVRCHSVLFLLKENGFISEKIQKQ